MTSPVATQTRYVHKAERLSRDYTVKPHPSGGFCIAERLAGSSAYIYGETHASERFLKKVLADRRAAAARAVFQGRIPGADHAKTRPAGQLWMQL